MGLLVIFPQKNMMLRRFQIHCPVYHLMVNRGLEVFSLVKKTLETLILRILAVMKLITFSKLLMRLPAGQISKVMITVDP